MSLKFTVSINKILRFKLKYYKTSFQLAALVLVLAVTYINCASSEAAESSESENSENDQTVFNIFCKSLFLKLK